ncbi:MAG: 16S rRNA (guanine(966)-N(2))-methyltransferase RsmD [Bacillota bacterium]|nr:16S rRNA (guanine(966)-N(2))-methyltransferase RsmD [Bacillota bacterium]
MTNFVGKRIDNVRIIAGEHKGRKLKTLTGSDTRPTLDKVRGAVFNALHDVGGARVLDMFGGSGAMALEALSRGAESCVIVDNSPKAMAIIEANTEALGYTAKVDLRLGDFRTALKRGEYFDLIILDPPYGQGLLPESIRLVQKLGLLRSSGIIVAETSAQAPEYGDISQLCLIKEKQYGAAKILYYRFDEE